MRAPASEHDDLTGLFVHRNQAVAVRRDRQVGELLADIYFTYDFERNGIDYRNTTTPLVGNEEPFTFISECQRPPADGAS